MQHDTADLAALIGLVAQGERQAFRELYGRTAPKLLGVLLRILKDRSRAEDVLQEVYLRVWQNASSYSPEAGRPMTWLIAVARHRAIDVVRQRREVTVSDGVDEADDWIASIVDPRDHESDYVELDRLRRCLGRLDEPQRRCLLEAYYAGYSREELSNRFGRPVNTIKTWLHRGANAVRSCLEEP